MTREEAIEVIKAYRDNLTDSASNQLDGDIEAFDIVIKALEQEPCEDVISRQAVIDAMYALCNTGETLKENPWRDNPHIDAIIDAIEDLPLVHSQPNKEDIHREREQAYMCGFEDGSRKYRTEQSEDKAESEDKE